MYKFGIYQEQIGEDISHHLYLYSTKYYKTINTINNLKIFNHPLINLVSEIGKIYNEEIKGKGSHQHKGIKKIINYCQNNKKVTLTVKEVKALFNSRTTLKFISNTSIERVFYPLQANLILTTIIEIYHNSNDLKTLCKRNWQLDSNYGCVDFLIPRYYSLLQKYRNKVEDEEKIRKKEFKRSKSLIETIVQELEEVNKVTL